MEDTLPLAGHSLAIFVTAAVMVGLSIIAVFLRCFVRVYIVRAFGWDDALMLIALALFIALCALCMLASAAGVGHKIADFTSISQLQRALKLWWLGQMLYLWASAVSKIAIALALLRLAVRRLHRFTLWAVCVVIVIIGLVFWLVLLFNCWPVEYFWERTNIFKNGKCISTDVLLIIAYCYSSLTIVCDVTLGILPACLIWGLQMSRRTKLALVGVLSLGAIASVAVVIRLPYLKNYSDTDFLYSTYQIAVWSVVETGLAIIAGSLITLRPLFRWFLDGGSSYKEHRTPGRKTTRKYALSTLTANASMPGTEDPKYWRPDLSDNGNTIVTSITAPLGRSFNDNSTVALSPMLPPLRKGSVSVHQTFNVSNNTQLSPAAPFNFGFPGQYSPAPVQAPAQAAPAPPWNARPNGFSPGVGHWMPAGYDAHHKWLGGVIAHVDSKKDNELHPVLKEFQHLIESNTRVYMLMSAMFSEIPKNRHYCKDPTGCSQIRDYPHMLQVLNHLLTTAPSWNDFSLKVGLVGLPINAVLDWSMGTPSGYAAYLDPDVNAMLKKVLDAWGEYLTSPESASVLDESEYGWFGKTGKENLEHVANIPLSTNHSFEELFVCDPAAKYHGYKSWDDFFTRLFRPGIRPVASPDDDAVIANACESQPYKVARHVKAKDSFWIKGQPYSMYDMLSHDPVAPQFEGGTVYQAFLSALSYHRWHAPVSGKIVKAYVVPGTYYSEPLFSGLVNEQGEKSQDGIDPGGEVTTQEYLSCVATRAIILIQCDNPAIGLMAFLGIGMCEVSTCDITVKEGQHVKKGDQLGMFHFGGSTHCLLFRKGVQVHDLPSPDLGRNVAVCSRLGVVKA
ncbi:phosphatidylserine decarboxylase family protein [Aspergillus mulundensis]|uniref:Uncharacterized protein n=1 Tax=Aspergillus mulundensis TaxID=1810919 RepID=A0A3D8QSR6_9EURO|nr:Uncharacterized protein DSM5745_09955 [Aspergillus mulundensis]RDW64544.1 Uncharacterized protein DSM5745_09955 [Aspergillus mulundensis]